MWVRKTAEDIAKDRRRLRMAFAWPALGAFILFVCVIVKVLLGIPTAGGASFGPSSWTVLLEGALVAALVVAITAYSLQLIFGRPAFEVMMVYRKVLICNKCFRVKSSDGRQSCDCSGTFEDFDLWKWVDNGTGQEGSAS